MGAAIIGLVVGLVVGMTSMGGGALMTPALVTILGISPSIAVASDVFVASLTKLVGAGAYAVRKDVHWGLVGQLALGSIPGALLGKQVLGLFHGAAVDTFVIYGLGAVLILASGVTLQRVIWNRRPPEDGPMPRTSIIILLGLITGFLVTVTSVGSGSLLMVALIRIVPLRLTKLVGTDLVHALILSAVATALQYTKVDWSLAGSALIGSVPGVLIGARFARTVPDRPLRAVLAGVLGAIGLILLVQGPHSHAAAPIVASIARVHP